MCEIIRCDNVNGSRLAAIEVERATRGSRTLDDRKVHRALLPHSPNASTRSHDANKGCHISILNGARL